MGREEGKFARLDIAKFCGFLTGHITAPAHTPLCWQHYKVTEMTREKLKSSILNQIKGNVDVINNGQIGLPLLFTPA